MNDYLKFIENKKHSIGNFGFKANYIPDIAFDFQKYVIEKAIEKGRSAVFLDTGLGKTLVQLSLAKNIINHTNKKVLILTPLAVAFQFILESEKLGIDDIEYSKDGKHTKKIVVCNYERLHYFNEKDFEGVQTVKNITISNKVGTALGYSQFAYDVTGATINNVVYPSLDPMIFEVKYPNTDIQGRVVNL